MIEDKSDKPLPPTETADEIDSDLAPPSVIDFEEGDPSIGDIFDPQLQKKWQPISSTLSWLNRLSLDQDVRSSLPRLCIIGMQTAGKSSIVEMMVGLECLPKGTGLATKRPTEINIIRDASCTKPVYEIKDKIDGEPKLCATPEAFKDAITALNSKSEGIVGEPIIATIRWAKAFNFIITDLPGMISTDPLPQQIAKEYVKNENTIILCVLIAADDPETSQAYNVVKEVDPKLQRTIFVRTKFDLYLNDHGRSIEEVLTIDKKFNEMTFCTLNRTAQNNADKLKLSEVFSNEEKLRKLDLGFIAKEFPKLRDTPARKTEIAKYRSQIGTLPLIEAIVDKFTTEVKKSSAGIMRKLQQQQDMYLEKQKNFPEPITQTNKATLFVDFCNEFLRSFEYACNGKEIGTHDAIEVLIRQKGTEKFDKEKQYLAERIEKDPLEMLLLWMEANGMQPMAGYVSHVFLNKCVELTLRDSKQLTNRMFDDVHRHILKKLDELFKKSKFNRAMQADFIKEIEEQMRFYKKSTEDLIERQFQAEKNYPLWEPEDFDRLDPNLSFQFLDEKKNPPIRRAFTLTREALEGRFVQKFGIAFKGSVPTLQSIKATTDQLMGTMQPGKDKQKDPAVLEHIFGQSDLREHLYKIMMDNRKKYPQIESKIANGILNAHLDKVELQVGNIVETIMSAFTYCYYMLCERKHFAAQLIANDYLDILKIKIATIIREPKRVDMMGEDSDVQEKRDKVVRNIEQIGKGISMMRDFFGS